MKSIILSLTVIALTQSAFANNGHRCFEAVNPEVISVTNHEPEITENAISAKAHTFSKEFNNPGFPNRDNPASINLQIITKQIKFETSAANSEKNIYPVECDGGFLTKTEARDGSIILNSDSLSGLTMSAFECSTGKASFKSLKLKEVQCTGESLSTFPEPTEETEPTYPEFDQQSM